MLFTHNYTIECFFQNIHHKHAFQLKPLRYKITMSGSGNQFWPILTESACTMQDFEKKSKSNRPIPPTEYGFEKWHFLMGLL